MLRADFVGLLRFAWVIGRQSQSALLKSSGTRRGRLETGDRRPEAGDRRLEIRDAAEERC
jgi:hypothetical protein